MSESAAPTTRPRFNPLAAVLAWIWPGLGHVAIGERRRGVLIMVGMLGLVASGVLVGGVDVVDRRNDSLWFLAQSGCGPLVFAVDYVNHTWTKSLPPDWTERPEYVRRYRAGDPALMRELRTTSLSHVNEMGTLFVALAGLMNLAVILDAMYFVPRPAVEPEPARPFVERRAQA